MGAAGMNVPFTDLKSEHRLLRSELLAVWDQMLDSGSFIGGSAVETFEKAFADHCETRHAIGVANGTDALVLALKALGIGAGDEVILPVNSFVATAEAVVLAGATPVFADVIPNTYNIDTELIETHITKRTKAIVAVHLYGQPCEMGSILEIAKRCGLRVVEDAAQAHGARYHGRRAGSMGDAGCFSFYPAKNLGACGDGGAVVTNDAMVAQKVRKLRDHGGITKYQHDIPGHNSRLDSMQAAALHLKLARLDACNTLRRQHAAVYDRLISAIDGIVAPEEPEGIRGVYHLYVARIEKGDRNDLQSFLAEHGVQTGIHYPLPIHSTPAFAPFYRSPCPVAEANAPRILSLPMFAALGDDQLEYVASLLAGYAAGERRQVRAVVI
jgi:dTDP-4-amino-4,6-dideoxygalactose transaminase